MSFDLNSAVYTIKKQHMGLELPNSFIEVARGPVIWQFDLKASSIQEICVSKSDTSIQFLNFESSGVSRYGSWRPPQIF